MQQRDDWLVLTRERLAEWGLVMRSVSMPGIDGPYCASHCAHLPAVGEIERYLCRIKAVNWTLYRVLFLHYCLNLSIAPRNTDHDRSHR